MFVGIMSVSFVIDVDKDSIIMMKATEFANIYSGEFVIPSIVKSETLIIYLVRTEAVYIQPI